MVKARSTLPSPEKKTLHRQFFKVFIPTQSSQRLRIPPDFIKHFNGRIPNKSIISTSRPRSWEVDMIEVDKYLYLDKGWERFVKDNELEFGDFLVFHYAGKEDFDVKVFAKDGFLKGLTVRTPPKIQPSQLAKVPMELSKYHTEIHSRLRPRNPKTGRIYKSKNISRLPPPFKVEIRPSYKTLVVIPFTFAESYLKLYYGKKMNLICSGKSWQVKLWRQRGKTAIFSAGWSSFHRDNGLQVGDVCKFQLLTAKNSSLSVTISRSENLR